MNFLMESVVHKSRAMAELHFSWIFPLLLQVILRIIAKFQDLMFCYSTEEERKTEFTSHVDDHFSRLVDRLCKN